MTGHDPEIEELRHKVHCAVVLERTPPPWKLDRKESTKLSLQYRRGKGEILIVSHAGRGWWDPTSDAKGDVFGLVQRLEPGLSFGHVRKRLGEFAGLSPRFPPVDRAGGRNSPDRPVAERWAERKPVWPNSPTWRYLSRKRGLPSAIIEAVSVSGVLREGPGGSAWFAHLDNHGVVAHVDVRGPTYKGSLTGGVKSLFRLPPNGPNLPRLVLAEAAIDALSVAAIESLRMDTLYAATGGGMGPGTNAALEGRYSTASQCSPARFSAALRTPMDRVIASLTATDRLAKNSGSHSRGFALRSRAATGTTSCAPDRKREERAHDHARHDHRFFARVSGTRAFAPGFCRAANVPRRHADIADLGTFSITYVIRIINIMEPKLEQVQWLTRTYT
jgi:hypothetical protein